MKRLLDWVQGFALALGGPGLFLIAFLDSSFLSFPEVVDLLIVWLTIQHPHRMVYYALLATLGSVAGCLVALPASRARAATRSCATASRTAHRAGNRRRAQVRPVERARARRCCRRRPHSRSSCSRPASPRCGLWISCSPSRSDGAFATSEKGLLALWYGERAVAFLRDNARQVGLWMAVVALVLGVGAVWWQRRQRALARSEGTELTETLTTEKRN